MKHCGFIRPVVFACAGVVGVVAAFRIVEKLRRFDRVSSPRVHDLSTGKPAEPPALTHGTLPLSFEPNHGQAASEVEFLSHGRGYVLGLTAHGGSPDAEQQR